MLLAWVPGCTKSHGAQALLDRNMEIFDQAIQIVEDAGGDQDVAEAALRKFLAQNRAEIRDLRTRGTETLKAMPAAEAKDFAERAQKERVARQTRLENLARTYKDPLAILSIARLAH